MEKVIKFKVNGVLLRHYQKMGTNVIEPFKNFEVSTLEEIYDKSNELMVDNIIGCMFNVKTITRIEFDDENYFNSKHETICLGDITEKDCENMKNIMLKFQKGLENSKS